MLGHCGPAQTEPIARISRAGTTNNQVVLLQRRVPDAGTTAASVVNVQARQAPLPRHFRPAPQWLPGLFITIPAMSRGASRRRTTAPSPARTHRRGALRFTNVPTTGSYPQGFQESGAILSNFVFPLSTQGMKSPRHGNL